MSVRKIGGASLTDKTARFLVLQLLSDVRQGAQSKGTITFQEFDYEVIIRKVQKKKPSFWSRIFGKGKKNGNA